MKLLVLTFSEVRNLLHCRRTHAHPRTPNHTTHAHTPTPHAHTCTGLLPHLPLPAQVQAHFIWIGTRSEVYLDKLFLHKRELFGNQGEWPHSGPQGKSDKMILFYVIRFLLCSFCCFPVFSCVFVCFSESAVVWSFKNSEFELGFGVSEFAKGSLPGHSIMAHSSHEWAMMSDVGHLVVDISCKKVNKCFGGFFVCSL